MKILEAYAMRWLATKKASDKEGELVMEFAREIEKLMGIIEEVHEKN